MTREILFRAKRADSDTWIEGNLLTFDSRRYIINDTESIYYCPQCDREEMREMWFAVIPETVSQFTGLYDINGKKIFEGDIIKLTINRSLIFSVNWVDDCGMFCLKCLSRHPRLNLEAFDTDFTTFDGDECEIIGNVFDNSDLLKGE